MVDKLYKLQKLFDIKILYMTYCNSQWIFFALIPAAYIEYCYPFRVKVTVCFNAKQAGELFVELPAYERIYFHTGNSIVYTQ